MLREAHISRLERRYGIPSEAARKLAEEGVLASVDAAEIARLCGRRDPGEGGGILIRYPNAEEMFAVRLDVPRVRPDGKVQKYDRPAGLPPRLFVPPGLDLEGAAEIWITEGELKALAGTVRGLPAAALAGVYNWRRDADQEDPAEVAAKLAGPGGKAPDLEALIDDLRRDWSGKTVVLVYDSDITREHDAWPAYGRLAEQLYARGAAVVKVVALPKEPPLDDEDESPAKTGLDDYLRRREARGFDAAAELRELVARTPEWVPTGGELLGCREKVGGWEGAWLYALPRLKSGDPDAMRRAAAALLAACGETGLKKCLEELGLRAFASLKADGKAELERIRHRQAPRLPPEAGKKELAKRTVVSRFPPASEVVPEDFPFPEAEKGEGYYDIRGDRVVRVYTERSREGEERERVSPVVDTVLLLARRLDPVERGADSEKWTIAWWERGDWRYADVAARWLFDSRKVGELIALGVPVCSENAHETVTWLHALRALAVLGHQEAPELPTVRAVNRCGWHELEGRKFFVWGGEIILPDGTAAAEAADREEVQADATLTDADIRWAEDISDQERQILAGFRAGGDPEEHRRFLLEAAAAFPQVAFGLGLAAGAPLLQIARRRGLSEIAGFMVLMCPPAQEAQTSQQGKTTWNAVVASLYGWPEDDGGSASGRLRFADRTRTALGVLLSTCSDLTVHLEELQLLTRSSKKDLETELEYLVQMLSKGLDRERGARAGGGRRTRSFRAVVFATAERDVTAKLPPNAGVHRRILKLPPLLEEHTDENMRLSEALTEKAMTHYGHAGRRYLEYLVRRAAAEGGEEQVAAEIRAAVERIRERLPAEGPRRYFAARLAKRAGLGLAGLALLLDALEAQPAERTACLASFVRCWDMIVERIDERVVAETALDALRSYIAANAESIANMREADPDRPPSRWVGAKAEVVDDAGRKVTVVALTDHAFAEAVAREPFGLDPKEAVAALAAADMIVTRTEKRDGKTVRRPKILVKIQKTTARCVCLKADLVGLVGEKGQSEESGGAEATEEFPF